MSGPLTPNVVLVLVLVLFAIVAEAARTPPGIANNPSHAVCKDPTYKQCQNLVHVCPKFCPDSCHVNCQSCKPICGPEPPSGSPPSKVTPISAPPTTETPPPTPTTPVPEVPPTPTKPAPSPPNSEEDGREDDKEGGKGDGREDDKEGGKGDGGEDDKEDGKGDGREDDKEDGKGDGREDGKGDGKGDGEEDDKEGGKGDGGEDDKEGGKGDGQEDGKGHGPEDGGPARRKRCHNRNYSHCYGVEHVCPSSCPHTCMVDCVTCKPVCSCDMPGAVCQDPRFIGGDGVMFYFHGKKNQDFCLVTDPNLHINAHFIGKRNENMKRDFTWVQSIGILFGNHRFFLGAQKTATWNNAIDRLSLSFEGEPIVLPPIEGAMWQSKSLSSLVVKRDGDTNSLTIEVDGLFKISAKVVPITKHESDVHNYGITDDDCFAHLELAFKFYSLGGKVNGVLGQTYQTGYVSRAKMGVAMPVLGGEREFKVSNLFATDCSVSQFVRGNLQSVSGSDLELPSMKCSTGIRGNGVVCKR